MDLLNEINIQKRFRDPIYGYIWLTEPEVKIVDTAAFQRLRRIQQLALTKYVYPTAEHSRFVHSLGVLQSATNTFIWIYRKNASLVEKVIKDMDIRLYFRTLRYAALLHDIGHLPFSHGAENELFPTGVTHENVSSHLIMSYGPIANTIRSDGVNPAEVASLISGQYLNKFEVIKLIISGEFDADRADYLLRDSYFCGVAYGNYDYDRYRMSFRIVEEEDGKISLTVDEGNVSVLESFLIARYHYNMQVPFHRTRVGYDLSLGRFLRDLKANDKLPTLFTESNIESLDMEKFIDFDDYSVFNEAKIEDKNSNPWAAFLLRKRHLKPIFNRTINGVLSKEEEINFKDLIIDMKNEGFQDGEDFFSYRKPLDIHRFTNKSDEASGQIEGGPDTKFTKSNIDVVDKHGDRIGDIVECSALINKFAECPVKIFRVYITPENIDRTERIYHRIAERSKERKAIK